VSGLQQHFRRICPENPLFATEITLLAMERQLQTMSEEIREEFHPLPVIRPRDSKARLKRPYYPVIGSEFSIDNNILFI